MRRWVNGAEVTEQDPLDDLAVKWVNDLGQVRWQPRDGHRVLWRGDNGGVTWDRTLFGIPKLYRSRARAERVVRKYRHRRAKVFYSR